MWIHFNFNHFSVKLKYEQENLFLNSAFLIKEVLHGRIILVSFCAFLYLSKMIPNKLPDAGLRLEFIDRISALQSNATEK